VEHLQHFGLTQDPFNNEPDLRFYFDSACHREAMLRVDRGLRQNKGFTLLTGEPGTGKTLLARRLFESLEEEIFEVALMVILPGAADAHTVLTRFAKQLGVEEPNGERSALLGEIYEQLAIVREEGRHAVLIIDDAHALEASAMTEIAGLLNLEYEDKRLLSLLMVGQPELDQCLARDASLLQRVDVRVRLEALDLVNTTSYVAHRIATVGGKLEIVPTPTIESLFKFSRGRTRLVNTLADNALFEAYLGGRHQIEPADVERAASDLGIGMDPGMTYGPQSLGNGASMGGSFSYSSAATPQVEGDPVMGDLDLPPADSMTRAAPARDAPMAAVFEPEPFQDAIAFEDPLDVQDPAVATALDSANVLRDLESDISDLFDSNGGTNSEPVSELGTDEIESVFSIPEAEPALEAEPVFAEQVSSVLGEVEATRVVFDVVDGPGAPVAVEELDDLFVELIED
jgi:general secretion pathway protein A